MDELMTSLPAAVGIVVRTFVVYFFVFIGIRLSGKREVGQMTPFDLVLILLLANSVQNSMIGQDSSLVGGLISAAVLLLLNAGIAWLAARNRAIGMLIRGHPRLLMNRGVVLEKNLKKEGIEFDELMQALREHGVASVEDVRLAVLEVDGTISVLKNEDVFAEVHKPYGRFKYRKTQ